MIEIVVPQVGEATGEVTLVRWLKGQGDAVRKGEPLFELDTDKYVVEIEAFESGELAEILVSEGSQVMPLQVVGRLATEEPVSASAVPAAGAEEEAPRPTASGEPAESHPRPERGTRALASPKARRVAAELGVDLAGLAGSGTGPGGLVTADDVEAALGATSQGAVDVEQPMPLSRLRRSIAEQMRASKREVPHFYLTAETDMAEALRLRGYCTGELGWPRPPTLTDLVVAACARALGTDPAVNVSFTADGLVSREHANVGIAVGVEGGLLVPVLRDAGALDLETLSAQTRELVDRARAGRLREGDVGERSMIVSNLGMQGVDAFMAIIDMPDPMILAVGRVAERCVPVEGLPGVRPMCTLTLSVDHRALDGVPAARFLGTVRARLENAFELLRS